MKHTKIYQLGNIVFTLNKFLSILLLIFGIIIAGVGLHNVDIAYNMSHDSVDYDGYIFRNGVDLYCLGFEQIFLGLSLLICCGVLLWIFHYGKSYM